jgi:hypothetical protein
MRLVKQWRSTNSGTILSMSASFTRRRLKQVERTKIVSYYTPEEKQEITKAAKRERISLSSFVASAALKEARHKSSKHP